MHLKNICWEVDWLFSIGKTVMTGEKREKKKTNCLLLFPWVDFLRGESFWSLSYQVLLQSESQESWVRVQIPRQAEAWQPPGDWIPGQVESGWHPENWVPGQVKACQPPGTPGLADPQTGWGMTNFQGPNSYAGRGRSSSWDPQAGVRCPQVSSMTSAGWDWRVVILTLFWFVYKRIGIAIMMESNTSLFLETGNLGKQL